jgi:hypothetical protein
MNKSWIFLALMLGLLLGGCKKTADTTSADDGVGTRNLATWNDPNFNIITVGSYNYTDYDIGAVFLMPTDKNDIKYAGETSGPFATKQGALSWSASSGSGPALAWDLRWKAPHKFKVWWFRVVDEKLYDKSGQYPKDGGMYDPYDPYITKQTRPGSAWCEGEVEIKEEFIPLRSDTQTMIRKDMMLYFYPDGTVKGHLLEYGRTADETPVEPVDITKRDELPTLKGHACIKEVPNPFYGKKRPISIH